MITNKCLLLILTMLCLGFSLAHAKTTDLYQFATPNQHQRFHKLTFELRCLVCQNQNLADSEAPLAKDLRQQVATKIRQGQTDKQIIDYLVKRYGDFILFKPPLLRITFLLWFGPFILALASIIILLYSIRKKPKQQALTQDDQARLNQLLKPSHKD